MAEVDVSAPVRKGEDFYGRMLGYDIPAGDTLTFDFKKMGGIERVAYDITPGAGAEFGIQGHMGARDANGQLTNDWFDLYFADGSSENSSENKRDIVNVKAISGFRVNATGGQVTADFKFTSIEG